MSRRRVRECGFRVLAMASRPERVAPPEIFYDDTEARKYTSSSRIIDIQVLLNFNFLSLFQFNSIQFYSIHLTWLSQIGLTLRTSIGATCFTWRRCSQTTPWHWYYISISIHFLISFFIFNYHGHPRHFCRLWIRTQWWDTLWGRSSLDWSRYFTLNA